MKVFNVARLIEELGGVRVVAAQADVGRTAPYGWIRRNYICIRILEKLKHHNPELRLDNYFDEEDDNEKQGGYSTGVPGERLVDYTD